MIGELLIEIRMIADIINEARPFFLLLTNRQTENLLIQPVQCARMVMVTKLWSLWALKIGIWSKDEAANAMTKWWSLWAGQVSSTWSSYSHWLKKTATWKNSILVCKWYLWWIVIWQLRRWWCDIMIGPVNKAALVQHIPREQPGPCRQETLNLHCALDLNFASTLLQASLYWITPYHAHCMA